METGIVTSDQKRVPILPLVYEFLGTALVTYSFTLGSQSHEARAVAYLIGWVLASQISGAHFNPAVTLAVYILERKRHFSRYAALMIAS